MSEPVVSEGDRIVFHPMFGQRLVTLDGETRVFSRNSSYHIVSATEDALRRDVNRHGVDVLARTEFEALPVARFRETKAGKALLLAA